MQQNKNACSIPECEHYINDILNSHKYYRLGKKEVVNTSQKILFLVYVSLHHAHCCFDGMYSIPCLKSQQNHHRNSCPMTLMVLYSIKTKKKYIAQFLSYFLQKLQELFFSHK